MKLRHQLLSLALAALLLYLPSVEAQKLKKIPRLGFISMSPSSAGGQNLEALRFGLRDLGYGR